jgi:hypothetical protein
MITELNTSKLKYRLIVYNNSNCFEGNWDKEVPVLKLIQCSVDEISLSYSIHKRIELKNFELVDGNKVAVVNSRIEFQLN